MICGEPLGPRVSAVSPLDDYVLHIVFTNGEHRRFDAKPLLSVKAFEPLRNRQLFKAVKAAYGSVQWPNDIDYCPDTLYAESVAWDPDYSKVTPDEADAHEAALREYAAGDFFSEDDIDWN